MTIQIVQAGGALADAPSHADAPSQPAAAVTQIQLACLSHCFNTSSSNPAAAAATQQVLADLSSLVPPSDPPSPAPVAGAQQTIAAQTSCEQQTEQSSTNLSQAQSASQSSTTVQLVEGALPSAIGSTELANGPAAPSAVSQTVQTTWQLQIGCLFYCVDSDQIQHAGQSSTTVEVVTGQPVGSDGGAVATVTQVIWQIQVGCLSWCYDTTQVQEASTESSVVLLTDPPPDAPTPVPDPVSSPVAGNPAPTAASVGSPVAEPTEAGLPPGPPQVPSSSSNAAPTPTLVSKRPTGWSFPSGLGRATQMMVGTLSPATATRRPLLVTRLSLAVQTVERWPTPLTVTRAAGARRGSTAQRRHRTHPVLRVARPERARRGAALAARGATTPPGLAIAAVLLTLLAVASTFATFRARTGAGRER